jgi:sterol desaturase/sphingolipid hydroxylase (fatty acid hydroxylase superfamily)
MSADIFAEIIFVSLTTVVTVSLGVVLEAAWRRTGQLARTVAFNTMYAVLIGIWARVLQPFADAEGAFLQRHLGITPIPLPEHGWLVLFSATVVMLAEDLIFYWVHRAQHRYEWLWAMHSFHHSDDDLNVTSSYRHYWIERPFWVLFYVPLGLVFRISPDVAAVYGFMFTFFAMFPHMNIRLELGPLTRIVLGPQLHRIHHSVYREHFNTNFAGAFPVWDLVFGTYRAPGRGEFPPTGVPDMVGRPSPLHVLLWPMYRPVSAERPRFHVAK